MTATTKAATARMKVTRTEEVNAASTRDEGVLGVRSFISILQISSVFKRKRRATLHCEKNFTSYVMHCSINSSP